jgi:hypothetical protein
MVTNSGLIRQIAKAILTNKNVGILNDAQRMNLGLADQQYTRQELAKSNTKAINHAALDSIASKYLQHEADNIEI